MDNKDILKPYFVKKRKSIIFDNHCKTELLNALNNNYSKGKSLNLNWALELLDIIDLNDSTYNIQILNLACLLDITPIIEKLIKLDAKMDCYEKDNALQLACEKGNSSAVHHLLKYGANINIKNNFCLITAIKYGHIEVVNELILNGADISFSNGEALKIAREHGHFQIESLLLNNGVSE